MVPFYLILVGMYLFYAKSKYFPLSIFRPDFVGLAWVAAMLMIVGSVLFFRSDGAVSGLLMALTACTLAMGMVQVFAVLGKTYFYGLVLVIHLLLLFDLLNYAS